MKRLLFALVLLGVCSVSLLAQNEERVAKQTRISKQGATTTGDRGLFTVSSVETLNKGQFSFGFGWNNTDRTPRDLDINSFPVYAAYGLLGRLTLLGSFETQKQVTARNFAQPGFNASFPFTRDRFRKGVGDLFIGGKYRLQRRRDNIGGLSLGATVKAPTSDAALGLGTGGTDVRADLMFTSLLPSSFVLSSVIGFNYTGSVDDPFSATTPKVRIKDEVRGGVGIAWPSTGIDLGAGTIQTIFEYTTVTYVGAGSRNLATAATQNSSDLNVGLRYLFLNQGLTLSAGYRNNVKFDVDFVNNKDRHGLVASLTYTKPVSDLVLNNHLPLVVLETTAAEVPTGGTTTIVATGFDADNDELTYTWTTTGGQITGMGDRATFSAAGAAAGTYTVRASANDGKQGVSNADLVITVR
jgi:hypothetical protein